MIKYYLVPIDETKLPNVEPAYLNQMAAIVKNGRLSGNCTPGISHYIMRIESSVLSEFTEVEKLTGVLSLDSAKWSKTAIKSALGISFPANTSVSDIQKLIANKVVGRPDLNLAQVFGD